MFKVLIKFGKMTIIWSNSHIYFSSDQFVVSGYAPYHMSYFPASLHDGNLFKKNELSLICTIMFVSCVLHSDLTFAYIMK